MEGGYRNEQFYLMVEAALSDEKIASVEALGGKQGESHLAPSVREAIALEITIRALTLMKMESTEIRSDEADRAIESIVASTSLSEAKAKAIWRRRNLHIP